MKGSQGLEALAKICGGASKAFNEESNQRRDSSNQALNQNGNNAIGTQQSHLTFPRPQLDQFSVSSCNNTQNSDNNPSQSHQKNQNISQLNPQLAALLSAGLTPQNMNNSNNDGNLTLQQMVYLNLLPHSVLH
mmetsp:Transcript_22190/g.25685  ORF Transcript_22190/g.25685 Transcript_22190/m.25685 type:complete len:133 (+) Transcript_22190:1177-1575(+)